MSPVRLAMSDESARSYIYRSLVIKFFALWPDAKGSSRAYDESDEKNRKRAKIRET